MEKANGSFNFIVENSKEEGERSTEPAGGIGLANVKHERFSLELLYPDRYKLNLDNNGKLFRVDLMLKVQ